MFLSDFFMNICKTNCLKRIKMKRKWLYVLLGFLWLTFSGLYAQEQTVTGVVKDQDGRPLLGVSVVEKGTTQWSGYRFGG